MQPPRIALVTAAGAARLDEDLAPLSDALRRAGARPEPAVWDDPAVDWGSYALSVVRSTWDYARRRDEFLRWAVGAPRLRNPEPILRWCTDKRYLRDLASAGVPVVPSHWIEPGGPVEIPFEGEVVVKPAVGAGSIDAARHRDRRAAAEHAARLASAGRAALVQPYLAAVETRGETALAFFQGRYSHAFRKGAMLRPEARLIGGLFLSEEIGPAEPTAAQRAVAELAVRAAPRGLYARVDLVDGPNGETLLLEFEAAEPSFYFDRAPGSADRFAAAILAEAAGER